jgi:hypothetical protein
MKRFGIILTATFAPFLIIGYLFGNLLFKDPRMGNHHERTVQAAIISQRNYVYIQIEKIPEQPVRLVSIWALFFMPADQPIATFIRLYPSNNPTRDALLASELIFGSDMELNQSFNEVLTRYYEINWEQIVIMDQVDLANVFKDLDTTNPTPSISEKTQNQEIQSLLQSLCTSLLSKDPLLLGTLSDLTHTATGLELSQEDLLMAYQWLSKGKSFSNCEIQVP